MIQMKSIKHFVEVNLVCTYLIIKKQFIMGGCLGKQQEIRNCTKCGITLSKQIYLSHNCDNMKPVIRLKQPMPTPHQELMNVNAKGVPDQKQKIKIKVPKDQTKTKFRWKEEQAYIYNKQIMNISKETMKQANFQQKMTWFRLHLEKLRVSWKEGSEVLKVDRWNILFSSLQGIKNKNMYKELKIQFTDEKVDDAGGLLRQWMHLCIKQIMSAETGIFKQCVTQQTAYKIIWDKNIVEQVAAQSLNLLGLIIGKAIFQRISLNCYLDRTILRQLCSQSVHLHDVYSYDKNLYYSWSSMLHMQNVAELTLDGCVYHTHGQNDLEQIQLFKDGKTTLITNENRDMYIESIINLYCTKSIQNYIKVLKASVYKIIPQNLLSIFQPHQIEMILNGPSIIDIKDWRSHTVYDGYTANDKTIQWFWEHVQTYDQEGLRNLLHYCTGSARVPILGFKYLESNRGEVKPFTIRKIQHQKHNPYPRSHTCFNRLQLPNYQTKQQLQNNVRVIMVEQITHFGLS